MVQAQEPIIRRAAMLAVFTAYPGAPTRYLACRGASHSTTPFADCLPATDAPGRRPTPRQRPSGCKFLDCGSATHVGGGNVARGIPTAGGHESTRSRRTNARSSALRPKDLAARADLAGRAGPISCGCRAIILRRWSATERGTLLMWQSLAGSHIAGPRSSSARRSGRARRPRGGPR